MLLTLPLETSEPVSRMTVRFLTPTELKGGGEIVREPSFRVLFGRVRDRIVTLRKLYGRGPLPVDFQGQGERADRVELLRSHLQWENWERRSSKTGQRHSLGGFEGEAEYEGDLSGFFPYIKVAKWIGIGRQTTWGKGHIEVVNQA